MVWTLLARLQEDVREIRRQVAELPAMKEKVTTLERHVDAASAWRAKHEELHVELAMGARRESGG